MGGGLFGLGPGAGMGGEEEGGLGVVAEAVAQDAEGGRGVAEGAGDLVGGAAFDEIGAQGLILALLGHRGLEEEGARVREYKWFSDNHALKISHTRYGVKGGLATQRAVGRILAIIARNAA